MAIPWPSFEALGGKGESPKGGRPEFLMWGELMELEDARVGTRVRVLLDYKEPHLQGSVGTINKRYGMPNYGVFEVLFPDGRMELFWDH